MKPSSSAGSHSSFIRFLASSLVSFSPRLTSNLNPTLKTIKEIGGAAAKGEKFLSKPDVFPMYKACKDSKDQGGFHDFVEILKLYDKNDDNTMLSHELFRLLTNLGEKLTKEEAKSLMKELCEPADDEGFMPFIPFLERMCAAEK